jgi:hypothetical protein
MDKAALHQILARRHLADPLVAVETQLVISYFGFAIAFHAKYHLRETPLLE